jgi:hypothetical protein
VSERARELAEKRAALQARCAAQRDELAALSYHLEMRLSRVDRAVYLVRRALSAPVLLGIAVVIGFMFGPRKLIRLASRSAFMVSMVRRLAHR